MKDVGYKTFLCDRSEMPRLSILENYRQISRIMTSNYMKGRDLEQRYKNVKGAQHDEEYQRYAEEELNSRKMATILKSLNSPKRKTAPGFFQQKSMRASHKSQS